jgi:hypothetical protein
MGRETPGTQMDANYIVNILMHVYGIGIDEIIETIDRVGNRDYNDNPVIFIAPGKCHICQQETNYNVWMLLDPKRSFGNTNVEMCGDCIRTLVDNLSWEEELEDDDE